MYQYTECGLDNVTLENGYEIHDTAEGRGVSIHDIDGLHRAIAKALIDKAAPLTGAEFRFLRTELDLSQNAIGNLMERTDQMVAKWEKGESSVPRLADAAIRNFYVESRGKQPIAGLLQRLAELDREIHRRTIALSDTEQGWVAQDAA